MKINIDSRLQEAVASGKSFDEQLAEVKASGKPFGLVSDMKLGKHIIYHSADEIADAQARTAAEAAEAALPKPPRVQSLEERVLIAKGLATKDDCDTEYVVGTEAAK